MTRQNNSDGTKLLKPKKLFANPHIAKLDLSNRTCTKSILFFEVLAPNLRELKAKMLPTCIH